MRPGFQFQEDVEDLKFRVVYTVEFVTRYDKETDRPAASRYITEKKVKEKILEAIWKEEDEMRGPEDTDIYTIATTDPGKGGIIVSESQDINMAFVLLKSKKGFMVKMTTIMMKVDFRPHSVKDYVVKVNPPVRVKFKRGLSQGLKDAVLSDLIPETPYLEDQTAYHLESDLVRYWVERWGKIYFVDDAEWIYDVVEIQVA